VIDAASKAIALLVSMNSAGVDALERARAPLPNASAAKKFPVVVNFFFTRWLRTASL